MTHTTEQERALSSLRHLYQQMAGGMVKDSAQAKRIAEGLLSPAIAKLEQAARRAPAAPVPQGWKLVPVDPTQDMIDAADQSDREYSQRAFGGAMHLSQSGEDHWHAMLAAAPQPPEAAPVQMPTPDSYIFQHEETGITQFVDAQQVEWGFEKNNPRWKRAGSAYTEQQVRQILATAKVERKPLTDEAIRTLYGESDGHWQMVGPQVLCFARSIESAHGIQEQST